MRARCPLAVCGVIRATDDNSPAVKARPSTSTLSMLARAGSPAQAATIASLLLAVMAANLDRRSGWRKPRHFGGCRSKPMPSRLCPRSRRNEARPHERHRPIRSEADVRRPCLPNRADRLSRMSAWFAAAMRRRRGRRSLRVSTIICCATSA